MAYYNDLKKYGDNIAAIDETGDRISYGQLDIICKEIGRIIPERSLAFSFCENTIGSLCSYVSALYNNIVPLLLNKEMEHEMRSKLIQIYKPAYLFIPKDMQIYFPECEILKELFDYYLLRTNYDIETTMAQELGLLLTTSGSTGSPKLVRQSYHNIQANAESIAQYLTLDQTERPITTLPMNYTYGLSIINSHLLVGATILLTKATLMEKRFWEFLREQKATSFGGVPYTYEILKKLRFFKMQLPSLRTMTQAGGKLLPELHKEFAEYAQQNHKRFFVMYGQTEATARMAYLPHEKAVEKYGSMGIAIPKGKLWLKDLEGNEIVAPEVIGELIYEGPNVTLGYAICAKDLCKKDERNGLLETGDMATRDADGFFYIVGRKKRFLKIFGNRVNLDEIEQMIKSKFTEIDCACAGFDDELYVLITDNDEIIRKEIKSYLTLKTGLNSISFHVLPIEQIPKNEAGKTLYTKLNDIINQRKDSGVQ